MSFAHYKKIKKTCYLTAAQLSADRYGLVNNTQAKNVWFGKNIQQHRSLQCFGWKVVQILQS